MPRIPGPIGMCLPWSSPIDAGTLARVRMASPAEQIEINVARRRPDPRFSLVEQRVLDALDSNGMDDLVERAMFLAQVAHESQGFTRTRERLGYSATRLLEVFPKRFKDLDDASAVVAGGHTAIAERLYGGRADLGNDREGDGGRYIGRGWIQLTGRYNYNAAGDALGLDLIRHPELAEQEENVIRIALWFWRKDARIAELARLGDLTGVTRRINGATHGLADRRRRFERYLQLLRSPDTPAVPIPIPSVSGPIPQ